MLSDFINIFNIAKLFSLSKNKLKESRFLFEYYYKSRGVGKTTDLVKLSASTNIPIVCMSKQHIVEVAK